MTDFLEAKSPIEQIAAALFRSHNDKCVNRLEWDNLSQDAKDGYIRDVKLVHELIVAQTHLKALDRKDAEIALLRGALAKAERQRDELEATLDKADAHTEMLMAEIERLNKFMIERLNKFICDSVTFRD